MNEGIRIVEFEQMTERAADERCSGKPKTVTVAEDRRLCVAVNPTAGFPELPRPGQSGASDSHPEVINQDICRACGHGPVSARSSGLPRAGKLAYLFRHYALTPHLKQSTRQG
jgi:hypothetical protein